MNTVQVVETLKKEATRNPVMDAVCHVFAARERARNQVTVSALAQRMKREGFKYDEKDYESVLKVLGDLGVGRIQKDSRGNIEALTAVGVTLQSIGKAVLGDNALEDFKQRNKFKPLASPPAPIVMKIEDAPAVKAAPPATVEIKLNVKGASVSLVIPKNMSVEDIASLISKLG